MLRLHFSTIVAAPVSLGPMEGVLLVGAAMIEQPSGRPIARLRDHQWIFADRHFLRVDFEGSRPCELRFIGPHAPTERPFRPYRRGHAADGVIYLDGTPMAHYEIEADRWRCMHDGSVWPVLCIEPVTGER